MPGPPAAATMSYIMRHSYQAELRLVPKLPGSYWRQLAEEVLKDVTAKRVGSLHPRTPAPWKN